MSPRITRDPADWHNLFIEHEQSGQSAAAFCRERCVCPKHFSKRRQQLLPDSHEKKKSSFVSVTRTLKNPILMLECQHERTVIKIPLSVSATWLADFIRQLKV